MDLNLVEIDSITQKCKQSTESVPKQGKQFPKRISATHNFVYEFNPLATSATNAVATTKGLQNASNIGQGDYSFKPVSGKQNINNVQAKLTAGLPKLQSRNNCVFNHSAKQDMTHGRNSNLPTIKKQESGKFVKNPNDRRTRTSVSEIDHEVEKVKSFWRNLETGWTQSKHFANTQTRKLYDTLEKMSREIDKVQNSYLDPKSNQYLRRGAAKVLGTSQTSFEEKAGEIRDVLFPKGGGKEMIEETLKKLPNNTLGRTFLTHGNGRSETRSLLFNPQGQNFKNFDKSDRDLPSKFNTRNMNDIRMKSTAMNTQKNAINSEIEQYFEKYINDAERQFVNNKTSESKEFNSSTDDVTEMLKRLDMDSFDMFDIEDDHNDYEDTSLQVPERIKNVTAKCVVQKNVENENSKKIEKLIGEDSSSRLDKKSTRNYTLCSDTSIQTSIKLDPKENAFIEMGLHGLNSNVPRNLLTRILQSEYLKKDASLKPM